MRRVIVESPYAGTKAEIARNLTYLRQAMHDCLVNWKESPYASHGLYTQDGVLDDTIPAEREAGIQAGFVWRDVAEVSVFYVDLGMSRGMEYGLADADKKGREVQYRAFLDGPSRPSSGLHVTGLTHGFGFRVELSNGDFAVRETVKDAVEALREMRTHNARSQ